MWLTKLVRISVPVKVPPLSVSSYQCLSSIIAAFMWSITMMCHKISISSQNLMCCLLSAQISKPFTKWSLEFLGSLSNPFAKTISYSLKILKGISLLRRKKVWSILIQWHWWSIKLTWKSKWSPSQSKPIKVKGVGGLPAWQYHNESDFGPSPRGT